MHSNIRLSPTLETNNQISFLELLIIRKSQRLETDIYRKPTTTDTTINCLSNHPMEQKLAAYRYHIERMLRLPLNCTRQLREWKTILHIATSNNFPTTLLQKLKEQVQHKITTPHQPRIQKTTQNGPSLPSPYHTYGKSQIYLDTQTSKSVTNAATQ